MKKINTEVSLFLGINQSGYPDHTTRLEIMDDRSRTRILTITIDPISLVKLLGRQSDIQAKGELRINDHIGKYMENKKFDFEIPHKVFSLSRSNKEEVSKICKKKCPKGWTPDFYFNSQNSFYKKGDKCFASTIIRRYVDTKPESE